MDTDGIVASLPEELGGEFGAGASIEDWLAAERAALAVTANV